MPLPSHNLRLNVCNFKPEPHQRCRRHRNMTLPASAILPGDQEQVASGWRAKKYMQLL